jgi:hypothetical protein
MQASELILKLRQLIEDHGDLEVVNDEDEEMDIEFVEDVFVIS